MIEKILCVDDNPNILAANKRQFRKEFHIETALGGEEGLEAIDNQGPFAVIVTDMQMPVMDGVQFLALVRERAPDSVRMMLTGYANLQTAIEAVNEGNIFRFLTKPCPPETFAKALRAGIEQYRLITAERELLKNTLTGSVRVLTEILSLIDPEAFGRGSRIRGYVKDIAAQMQLPNVWQFELAAMLSQIGCVALPPEICDKVYAGESLSRDELEIFSSHPSVGCELLANIPRLEKIARMIEGQQRHFWEKSSQEGMIALGAQILKVALNFDKLIVQGLSYKSALSKLREQISKYNPEMVAALENLQIDKVDEREQVKRIRVSELKVGMIAEQDIYSMGKLLLVHRGQEVTSPLLQRLHNFAQGKGIIEPFRVQVTSKH